MENAALMGIVDGLGNGLYVAGGAPGGQWDPADQRRQTLPLDVIHRDEMLPFTETHFVDGDDAGMLQCGGGDGLGAETLHRLRRRVRPEQQQLESDDPVETLLAGLIDHAHATVPNFLQQLVLSETAVLRKARGRGECGRTVTRSGWLLWRRLQGFTKTQSVKAPGAESMRSVGREFRATTRTCTAL